MASTTTATPARESHKKLKPKPKTEHKSWQTRNSARKEKQTAHAAKLAEAGELTIREPVPARCPGSPTSTGNGSS